MKHVTSGTPADPALEDMTARARIREAAIRLFAEKGVKGTSILDIAKAAGVSGGLIRHHFGSKDGLRTACDTYVMDELVRFKLQVLEQVQADPDFQPTFDTRQVLLRRYVGRAMFDGSPAAATRFAETVDQTEQWFTGQSGLDLSDPRACAAVLTSMTIGVFAMQDQIARALDEDPLSPRLQERIAVAYADLYSPTMLPPDIADRARQMSGHQPLSRATKKTTKKKEDQV
jgi:TetR/AcrR family transcriptional regulator, regulator of cefoperazone and chloramphenicol sensitivity